LPQDQRLPIRPYAVQAYLDVNSELDDSADQAGFFDGGRPSVAQGVTDEKAKAAGLLMPSNGKVFKRFGVSDMRRLQAEQVWENYKNTLPYPKSEIPLGDKTKSGLLAHHYNSWSEMFSSRQLLALSTLLQSVVTEEDPILRESLLSAFSSCLDLNNLFTRYMVSRDSAGGQTAQGVFARHDYQPKMTITENNVFGLPAIGMGSFNSKYALLLEGLDYRKACWDFLDHGDGEKRKKKIVDAVRPSAATISCKDVNEGLASNTDHIITDPPYVGNVNYAELADFYYVCLRLALREKYPHFAPEYTPKRKEIVENTTRGKTRKNFFNDLSAAFMELKQLIPEGGLLTFTFHHTDTKGTVWEGLLESLCETGFEIVSIYPIHAEAETSLHLADKENVSYDLIHVCRKRQEDSVQRSWAGIRQEVRRRAREELTAIERGRYGNQPLPESDVRLICIGKCLELYSAHYGKVLDHENKPLPLHKALQDIAAIVDQLVTKDRPLPSELAAVDGLSYVWLRVLAPIRNEVMMDTISKAARGMQVSLDDLKDAGLVVRGRTGRGRTYEVKQPAQRLGELLAQYQPGLKLRVTQGELFTSEGESILYDISLVDLVHLVIGLAQAGESVVPWLERFAGLRAQLGAALRYVRDIRADWKEPIDRVLALIEGVPLLTNVEGV
jgi:hypothetical protein